ncbi:MAG: isocitrate dehydrogenase (NADP(+)) [Flavobacteriales bacterium]|nr:isocitrate dehydrogenase (NADP(+)) [Flavobacteriales bacterium]
MSQKIIYTKTDEAPYLATHSLLPIVRRFAASANIDVEERDISLAARILAVFPDYLKEDQRVNDALAELGELAKKPEANIIKLPNISASLPQLNAAIKELQAKGYALPDYPENPQSEEEKKIQQTYDKVKGSAVNPVLREGNSDRRAPMAVKEFAKKHPHSMGEWSKDSKSHVATMGANDFRANEKSHTVEKAGSVDIILKKKDGSDQTLKSGITVQEGEVIDGTFMSTKALVEFLKAEIADAKAKGVLFSVHMKATMMKVSDPIIFGYAIKSFFAELYEKYGDKLAEADANANDGLGKMIEQIKEKLDPEEQKAVLAEIDRILNEKADMAMVNSDKGITNLHVPSDVIIDASMPAMIRNGGKMWDKEGKTQDTKAVIPDSSYADVYAETIDFCRENGAFDPTTMGTVPNVGLMAQKAEEYGSHDKTFELADGGTVEIRDQDGNVLISHEVEAGDIWRMCMVKDAPIQNWVKLAVDRARATGWPAVFWLDVNRAHDAQLIRKVNTYLKDHDTKGLEILIKSPKDATRYTLERVKKGENTISVTGNVLRDYLTDLFPILELGTSAKMLSIVPLMNGGGLFETGAGGSAPKHVDQFVEENHLRWDSLGEFLAIAVSLEHLAEKENNPKAKILSHCLDLATTRLLMEGKSPSRKVGEPDNRSSHFYLALFWAQEIAKQSEDTELKEEYAELARELEREANFIENFLNEIQGKAVELNGYYWPDEALVTRAMRPCDRLNELL